MSRRRNHPAAERELNDLVYQAMESSGWTVPTTPEQVAHAEEVLWETSPEGCATGPPAFEEVAADSRARSPSPFAETEDTIRLEQTLARAARMGGELPPEVEETMRRDRDAAEAGTDVDSNDD